MENKYVYKNTEIIFEQLFFYNFCDTLSNIDLEKIHSQPLISRNYVRFNYNFNMILESHPMSSGQSAIMFIILDYPSFIFTSKYLILDQGFKEPHIIYMMVGQYVYTRR